MTRRNVLLAAASGLLLALSFPNVDLSFLAWIAFVPLFMALRDQTERTGFWLGGAAGLVYFSGTVYWVTNSVHFYGGIPLLPAAFITLLLCAYLALYPALFGVFVVLLRRRRSLFLVAAPAAWVALELARTYVFTGFPWALIGYTQYRLLPLIQIVDATGVYGVSFLIVLVNAAIVAFLENRAHYRGLVAAGALLLFVLGYGFLKLNVPDSARTVTVSVIQGNIEQDKKWDPAYQDEVLATYKRLTKQVIPGHPDLVIWPETATPFYFNGTGPENTRRSEELKAFVRDSRVSLLFGSPTYQIVPPRTVLLSNSAFLLNPAGDVAGMYRKRHLVPFGEYVPLKAILFFVEKMVQAIGDFVPGSEYTVMTIPTAGQNADGTAKIGTVICYEIIFPDLVRRFVRNGSTVMATITNDAWFGRTAAPFQHFSMAVFRAVENRVPVARAANTGVSGFIDATGRIRETTDIFVEAVKTRTLAVGNRKTLYTVWGDVFAYLCSLVTVGAAGFIIRERKRSINSMPLRHGSGRREKKKR